MVGRCRGLRRPGHQGHRFGQTLSRPAKAEGPWSSLWSAAVAASEGQCLGSCPRSVKINMSRQNELGQGPACSALAHGPSALAIDSSHGVSGQCSVLLEGHIGLPQNNTKFAFRTCKLGACGRFWSMSCVYHTLPQIPLNWSAAVAASEA